MTTISDKDRAEAQAMFEVYHGRSDLPALDNGAVLWWLAVRDHVLAAHECPTVPVWRPTTAAEIQPGWEVRFPYGLDGAVYTIAHHRYDGEWFSENDEWNIGDMGGVETSAPPPEPEPWDEALVGVVSDALAGSEGPAHHWDDDSRRVLDALAARGYLDRAAITGGGQS